MSTTHPDIKTIDRRHLFDLVIRFALGLTLALVPAYVSKIAFLAFDQSISAIRSLIKS